MTAHALPSPLEAAATLQTVPAAPHESVTALLGAWGELLLHDLASTGNLRSQDCCSDDGMSHGECYGRVGHGQCREYMRTLPAVDMDDCGFGEFCNQEKLETQMATDKYRH